MRRIKNPIKGSSTLHWIFLGAGVVFLAILVGVFAYLVFSSPSVASLIFQSPLPSPLALATFPLQQETPTPVVLVSPLAQVSATETPTPQVYLVQSGDTLTGIATQFGVTVEALKEANTLSSDVIVIGQQLIIPSALVQISTPVVEDIVSPGRYRVRPADTLESIAASQGIAAADLRAANGMIGDALFAGQFITLPSTGPVERSPWKFSTIEGDVVGGYPLAYETDRFTLHYQPDTFPSQDPEILAIVEADALDFLEMRTGLTLSRRYDVYVAGTNFEPPNRALRGMTKSVLWRTHFLHDGTGTSDDQKYIITHELTHLFMWNTVGSPSSTMLSEGVAVYFGMERVAQSEHMPLETFCAAYLQAGALPYVSSATTTFLGHIYDLQNYYAAGCFVEYLVESYGIESLKLVYHEGNYAGVYGKGLSALESDWRLYLASVPLPPDLVPSELVAAVRDLENSYSTFFPVFSGASAQLDAYRVLDYARIALLQGRLAEMQQRLGEFNSLLGQP